jgi:hypothetical protein
MSDEPTKSIRGHVPVGLRVKPPERHEEGRQCWCGTKLTAYNPSDVCYLHSRRKFRRVRGRPSAA